jgi:ADP-ribose pyrophosphatase YjhB (NUDIX family)
MVLDPDDRVLLFRYDDGPPNGRHWCTPGGGLNDGEDYPTGARRELAEETGWTDVPLGTGQLSKAQVFERILRADGIEPGRMWCGRWWTGTANCSCGPRGCTTTPCPSCGRSGLAD